MFEEHEWEVFSIYSIKVTDDYLQSDFDSDEELNKGQPKAFPDLQKFMNDER